MKGGKILLGKSMYGIHSLSKSAPNIIIFGYLAHHLQTFENVDDIIDASAFDRQLYCNLVEFEEDFLPAFKVVYELATEFLKALFLAIVGQNLLFYHFLLKMVALRRVALDHKWSLRLRQRSHNHL